MIKMKKWVILILLITYSFCFTSMQKLKNIENLSKLGETFFQFSTLYAITNIQIGLEQYKNVFNEYLEKFGISKIEYVEEQNDQAKKNYFWVKFFVMLAVGSGLLYWWHKRLKK